MEEALNRPRDRDAIRQLEAVRRLQADDTEGTADSV